MSQPLHVEVFSDYVCPWCYLLHSSLEAVREEQALRIAWRAFELQPREARRDETALAAKRAQIEREFDRLQRVAHDLYDVELRQGPWGVDSRAAHRGAKVAEAMEVSALYHRRVFAAYWIRQLDISQTDVLADIAESIGLARDPFLEAIAVEETLSAVLQDQQQAQQYRLNGVPAIVFAGRFLASGAMPPPELRATIADVRAQLDQETRAANAAPASSAAPDHPNEKS